MMHWHRYNSHLRCWNMRWLYSWHWELNLISNYESYGKVFNSRIRSSFNQSRESGHWRTNI